MSVVSEVLGKTGRALAAGLPKWPQIRLGRFLCRLSAAYASATSMAYRAATGFGPQVRNRHPSDDPGRY
ncbi:hypothetical protein EJ066_01715 [Mesorhizobium sp. M9A.F.Ca.ET.002.03.1.2]|uniref:hypothetical protein n=1 Tax=Mesorhizobium sp. M9A.F.Ca.ET.002.03.1.2 TaxID=2493668 RepID=UPI000F760502|nr:hypothetical protein [Mesorhizobium sp. M9A.F.Ca.ET.002.03.1.2]AZN96115.1 hypothetical protein EJ066_01715 [Mesorhizobium sp. M9A.F.Ca.ET.002.03.1.2]